MDGKWGVLPCLIYEVVANTEKDGMMRELKNKMCLTISLRLKIPDSAKHTSSDFLAVRGGSNGGLLVGAMTQRPELMKVALPAVGVMDMLRYHTFTSGAGWAYDYGTAQDSQAMFKYIKAILRYTMSSGHTISSDYGNNGHDDRVVPAHSFKFAAELQENKQEITLH
jgi:prolyl oligopeptidase PreP (S9A serine peptidase family)